MTKTETGQILSLLTPVYPTRLDTPEKAAVVAALWLKLFGNRTYGDLWAALESHMLDTEKGMFFPTPADLAGRMPERAAPRLPEPAQRPESAQRPGRDAATRDALAQMARYVLDNPDTDDAPDLPAFCRRYLPEGGATA